MRITKKIKKEIEDIALGTFLSDYTGEYEDILKALETKGTDDEENEKILIWEPFEHHPKNEVADHIRNLHDSILNMVKDLA